MAVIDELFVYQIFSSGMFGTETAQNLVKNIILNKNGKHFIDYGLYLLASIEFCVQGMYIKHEISR